MDRNDGQRHFALHHRPSLSARRAWIEIVLALSGHIGHRVALRKESVDRNLSVKPLEALRWASLSARRAWIEIQNSRFEHRRSRVALRKESVDRNCQPIYEMWLDEAGRSPQGERG